MIYFFLQNREKQGNLSKVFESILMAASVILTFGWFAMLFIDKFDEVNLILIKVLILVALTGLFSFLYFKIKSQRIVIFAIILIIARIGFDWFIWPLRAPQFEEHEANALTVAEITGDESVFYYHVPMLQYGASFYMGKAKHDIIRKEGFKPMLNTYYIMDNVGLAKIQNNHQYIKMYFQYPNVEDGRNLNLIKILD